MMTYLEILSSKVLFRWCLEKLRQRKVKASVKNVVSIDVFSKKTVPLERKKIQSTKSFLI